MDRNNWQSRNYHSKGKYSDNRRFGLPHNDRYNDNGGRSNSNTYQGERSNFAKRNYNTKKRWPEGNSSRSRYHPFDSHRNKWRRNPVYEESRPSTSSEMVSNELLPMSPLEAKVVKLIDAVRSHGGVNSGMILMQNDGDNSAAILQKAAQSVKDGSFIIAAGVEPLSYKLKINDEVLAEGKFTCKKDAKTELCDIALDKLRKTCFFITNRKIYEEVTTQDLNKSLKPTENKTMEGSKAHLMMLKMGWGGKGLGVNEQGEQKTVAETISQNITKEGLGGKNTMSEIKNLLDEFARSTKLTTLAFDSGFTKEERATIHQLASQLNLKSKSEGKGENRRITIGKKIARWDLVKELLLNNCINETYTLTIPSDFENLWVDESDDHD